MKILLLDFMNWVFPKTNHGFDFLKKQGVIVKRLVPGKVQRNARTFTTPTPNKACHFYKGFDLTQMIKVCVARNMNWYKDHTGIKAKWIKKTMTMIDWAYATFEKEKPDWIVIEGGLTYYARACTEVAREMGIKIIAIENSFIKDKIMVDFTTGFIVNRHAFGRCSQDWLDTRVLTKEREQEVDKIIKNVFNSLTYPTANIGKFPRLSGEKTILIPLQVFSDQVTLYDSPFNNETFIKEVLKVTEKHFTDWNIIFKCHPKEDKYRHANWGQTGNWLRNQKLPKNVTVLRSYPDKVINTQELMKKSDLIFVNTSQAGLEACLLEKPVVVFGDAFYANKGFTIDYNEHLDWQDIKKNPNSYRNINKMKIWFLYFYKFLYNKVFTKQDRNRVRKELNILHI